jgi:hypothetical protein
MSDTKKKKIQVACACVTHASEWAYYCLLDGAYNLLLASKLAFFYIYKLSH